MSERSGRRPRLRRFYRRLFQRFPWWVGLLLGLVAVGIGLAITAKPFASLGVLVALVAAALIVKGISEMASADNGLDRWVGIGSLGLGVVVAVWPGLTIRGLAILVGVGLLVGGLLRLASGFKGSVDQRLIAFLSGLARSIFGVLALSWPDITVLVLALIVAVCSLVVAYEVLRYREARVRVRHPEVAA